MASLPLSLNVKKWEIPLVILGILFFSFIGWFLSNPSLNLLEPYDVVIVNWCSGLCFFSMISLVSFRKPTYGKLDWKFAEKVIVFPVCLLLTSVLISEKFFPIISFFVFVFFWIAWSILRSFNKGKSISWLTIIILSWLVMGLIVSIGQYFGYSKEVIKEIYQLNLFLDLRISLSIFITSVLLLQSITKVEFNSIRTEEILKIKRHLNPRLVVVVEAIFLPLNFFIQIGMWLLIFFKLWALNLISLIKQKTTETKDFLFDLGIIFFVIIGFYLIYLFSVTYIEKYIIVNNTLKEIIPLLLLALILIGVLSCVFFIIRCNHLVWNGWKFKLDKESYSIDQGELRIALLFPLLASAFAGLILYSINNIKSVDLLYFKNYGLYSLIWSIGLGVALVYGIILQFSANNEEEDFEFETINQDTNL